MAAAEIDQNEPREKATEVEPPVQPTAETVIDRPANSPIEINSTSPHEHEGEGGPPQQTVTVTPPIESAHTPIPDAAVLDGPDQQTPLETVVVERPSARRPEHGQGSGSQARAAVHISPSTTTTEGGDATTEWMLSMNKSVRQINKWLGHLKTQLLNHSTTLKEHIDQRCAVQGSTK